MRTVLTEGLVGSRNMTVLYTDTDNYFQYYVFELLTPYSLQKKLQNDSDRSVVFLGLEGGNKYTVRVTAVSGDQTSPPQFILIQTGKKNTPNYGILVRVLIRSSSFFEIFY